MSELLTSVWFQENLSVGEPVSGPDPQNLRAPCASDMTPQALLDCHPHGDEQPAIPSSCVALASGRSTLPRVDNNGAVFAAMARLERPRFMVPMRNDLGYIRVRSAVWARVWSYGCVGAWRVGAPAWMGTWVLVRV